jgi:thiosulfate/3-mercaptopyruvate sulfurtransferase
MSYTSLISSETLRSHLDDPAWVIVDCRFWLPEPERGPQEYRQAHIPGAVYANLDRDLSSPPVKGRTGRHPLPEIPRLVQALGSWGIGPGTQVVAYDDLDGSIAGRLWWLLRWLGHTQAAVLDGGWQSWLQAGEAVRSGQERRPAAVFTPNPQPRLLASAEEVRQRAGQPDFLLIDARAPERYRGEVEPYDPVAGHIPGAISLHFKHNLQADGRFLPSETLRQLYQALLGERPVENLVAYCGSGINATHILLALEHAGLGNGRIYAGSWSDWVTDPSRPVARGG